MIHLIIILLTIPFIIWPISYGTYKMNADFLVRDGLDRRSKKIFDTFRRFSLIKRRFSIIWSISYEAYGPYDMVGFYQLWNIMSSSLAKQSLLPRYNARWDYLGVSYYFYTATITTIGITAKTNSHRYSRSIQWALWCDLNFGLFDWLKKNARSSEDKRPFKDELSCQQVIC